MAAAAAGHAQQLPDRPRFGKARYGFTSIRTYLDTLEKHHCKIGFQNRISELTFKVDFQNTLPKHTFLKTYIHFRVPPQARPCFFAVAF